MGEALSDRECVTVVIPAYNCSKFIEETLDSIYAQSGSYIGEVVVVDDGSTDDTCSVVGRVAMRAPIRTRLIRQSNSGPAAARNRGAAAGIYEWVAFLDADDLWEPHKIKAQMREMERRNVGACITDLLVVSNKLVPLYATDRKYGNTTSFSLAVLIALGKISMSTPTLVVKRSLFDNLGGFKEDMRRREDHEFLIRIGIADELCYLESATVKRRMVQGSLSNSGGASLFFGQSMLFYHRTKANFPEKYSRAILMHVFLSTLKYSLLKRDAGVGFGILRRKMAVFGPRLSDIAWALAMIFPLGNGWIKLKRLVGAR